MEQLVEWNQPIDMQGFDIRIFNREQGEALKRLKHKQAFKFAWDNPEDDIRENIELLTQYIKPYKLMCYVLVGFNTTPEQDMMRIKTLWENYKIHPFVMPFNKRDRYQMDISRWCNNKIIFKSCTFEEYMEGKNNGRR